MKTVKIVENEHDIKRVINEAEKYLEKHGIRVYAVIGECPALSKRAMSITNPAHYGPKTCLDMLDAFSDFNEAITGLFADLLKDKIDPRLLDGFIGGDEE